jgi:hypothetical protein
MIGSKYLGDILAWKEKQLHLQSGFLRAVLLPLLYSSVFKMVPLDKFD